MSGVIEASAETLLETALLAAFSANADVAAELGDPVRVLREGAKPFYPFFEFVSHQVENADGSGVSALRHVVDLRVHTRIDGEAGARDLLAIVRRAVDLAELDIPNRNVVFCYPVFTDVLAQRGVNLWRGTLRVRALTTAV